MSSHRILALAALPLAVFLCAGAPGPAQAAYNGYVQFDGIMGDASPPGFPDATQIYSFSLSQHGFSETQLPDPNLVQLELDGTSLNGAVAFYKVPINGSQPYEKIVFQNALVSSIQTTHIGPQTAMSASFQFGSKVEYLYLALPGAGRVPIDSLTITDNVFSVHRAVDQTSPLLAAAYANGALFPSASLLAYTDPTGGTPPDFAIVFDQALISSIVTDASGEAPGETIAFGATDANLLPEPAISLLFLLGAAATLAYCMRCRAQILLPEGSRRYAR